MKGLDVSYYQNGLDLLTAKNLGYEFAIIRGGYTGYGAGRSKNKDSTFEGFYRRAKEIKMPVGCYWYSCANTKAEGIDEAEMLWQMCLRDKTFEMPIYIDVEDQTWQTGRKEGVTDAIIGFCEHLIAKGYKAGVYASLDWFNNKIDTARLEKYTKWVAAWRNTKPEFKYSNFDLWQNADDGYINGMRVDTNIAYKDFVKVEPEQKTEVTCMIAMTQITKGDTGEQVKTAQALLANKWGYSVGAAGIDGIFGTQTFNATKKFQKAKGLVVDGIIGQNTWTALLH